MCKKAYILLAGTEVFLGVVLDKGEAEKFVSSKLAEEQDFDYIEVDLFETSHDCLFHTQEFRTSVEKDHFHTVVYDRDGKYSSKTDEANGHYHNILAWDEMELVDDHYHFILFDEVLGEYNDNQE